MRPEKIWIAFALLPNNEGEFRLRAWTSDPERVKQFERDGLTMFEYSAVESPDNEAGKR